ncbi:MAG: DHH family phosphoesterase, partial [Kiritimatiellae bacterium]|nr:DHH family phosphoesterase [Kiritimatiellia bacterium]
MAWKEREVSEAEVASLVRAGESPLMARLLALRGVSADTLEAFFNPSHKNLLPPSLLPGIAEAVSLILAAKKENKKTVIIGDYDCDGICATAILVKTLEILEFDVSPFLPKRMEEGYGLNAKTVERLLKEHPDVKLIVTVDNGINSVDEAAFLKSKGIDIVVTDHHLPGEELPDCPVVNPKVRSPDELSGLCGAGVAFMLANALIVRFREEGLYDGASVAGPLIVLAGLATITDIMPLKDQNRILVTEALKLFQKYAPIGLKELFHRVCRPGVVVMTSRDFGYAIGPRINASGRMS